MPSVAAPEFVRPAFYSIPPVDSFEPGREAVELAERSAGLVLDPWQAWAVEQALAERDGRSAAFEIGIVVGRQNGKGTILEALALAWLFLDEVDLLLWSAHEFKTAQDAFRRMRILLQGSEDLWPLVENVTTSNGNEAIHLASGQMLKFVARSVASGRGFAADRIILDEAYDLNEDEIAAMLPTLSTRPDPQVVYTSTAGMSHSHVLRAVRDRGRAGSDPNLCWLEWCAEPSGRDDNGRDTFDLDDRAQWLAANPGLKTDRISESFIAKERRAMSPERFLRERLGVWDEPDVDVKPIDPLAFAACIVVAAERPAGMPAFFLDVSPGMRSGSIAAAAGDEGLFLDLPDYRAGTDWLIGRAVELKERYPGASWHAEAAGAVGALLPDLAERGIEPELFTSADMGRACGFLQKLIADKAVQICDDEALPLALAGAVKRDVGEGLWAWGRRKSSADISPLVAITGAAWALVNQSDKRSEPWLVWQ